MTAIYHLAPLLQTHGPRPLRQKIPVRLESADLLVEPGTKGFIGLLPFLVVLAEDVGRSFQKGLLPGLDQGGMDLKPGGQLGPPSPLPSSPPEQL